MNQCAIQQNIFSGREEMRSPVTVSVSDRRDYMVCPKPRRLGLLNGTVNDHQPVRSFRWNFSYQSEPTDSKAGADLLDIILPKGQGGGNGQGNEQNSGAQVASSPPFFCGSPPTRVANPLIHDSRFGDDKVTPPAPAVIQPSPSSSARKASGGGSTGGCVRSNFGNNPAVRVEGFDCRLGNRDRRNCSSIPALA